MLGLRPYLAFAATARHGSFAAAARELGVAPSTLAKAVSRLEQALAVRLFHRTTRQVSLTADGERLFARCQRILAEIADLENEAAGASERVDGTLRIDMPVVYGRRVLLPIVAGLLSRHPGLAVDARFNDGYVDLVREGIDVAIRVGPLLDSTLVARPLDRQELLLCASPAYLDRNGFPASFAALGRHTAVVARLPTSGRRRPWLLAHGGRDVEYHPPTRVESSDGEGVAAAALLDLGLVQLPDYMVRDELDCGRLIEVLPRLRPRPQPISAVYPSNRLVPLRVRALLEAVDAARGRRPAPAVPGSPSRGRRGGGDRQ